MRRDGDAAQATATVPRGEGSAALDVNRLPAVSAAPSSATPHASLQQQQQQIQRQPQASGGDQLQGQTKDTCMEPPCLEQDSDDLIPGDLIVSLICPITKQLIKTPAKGPACKHIQTFDYDSFQVLRGKEVCPLCKKPCPKLEVIKDERFSLILATREKKGLTCTTVRFLENGEWMFDATDGNHDAEIIDLCEIESTQSLHKTTHTTNEGSSIDQVGKPSLRRENICSAVSATQLPASNNRKEATSKENPIVITDTPPQHQDTTFPDILVRHPMPQTVTANTQGNVPLKQIAPTGTAPKENNLVHKPLLADGKLNGDHSHEKPHPRNSKIDCVSDKKPRCTCCMPITKTACTLCHVDFYCECSFLRHAQKGAKHKKALNRPFRDRTIQYYIKYHKYCVCSECKCGYGNPLATTPIPPSPMAYPVIAPALPKATPPVPPSTAIPDSALMPPPSKIPKTTSTAAEKATPNKTTPCALPAARSVSALTPVIYGDFEPPPRFVTDFMSEDEHLQPPASFLS
ncbi:hypothetical protein Pelo_11922 [Pelomyxa schiedti]|nr:hypothetical protein Pelo_11922 [Pelomyxa schiedti]